MTYSSPSLTARVVALKKSDPPLGSVKASADINLPASSGLRYLFFCDSVPNLSSASPTIEGITYAQHNAVPNTPTSSIAATSVVHGKFRPPQSLSLIHISEPTRR